MRDLLIITPTRGRPDSALRLAHAVAETAKAQTDLILAVDNDDPSYDGLLPANAMTAIGPRLTCPAWTNKLAAEYAGRYRAFASLGDDHVPETPGWDVILLDVLDEALGGTGIVYGDDQLQHERLPTAPVISADIPAALGWLMYPGIKHVYADNVWKDLGRAAGCLRYVPEVVIRHLHWSVGTAPHDQTYAERDGLWDADEQAWLAWQRNGMMADLDKILALGRR